MKTKLFTLVLLSIFISCGQKQDFTEIANERSFDAISEQEVQTDIPENDFHDERMIIKEGEVQFETANAAETKELISKTVSELRGYISNENVYTYKDKIEYQISIRVPSEKFEILLDNISQSAKNLKSKNIKALDVTEEYVDIEARIKTKKELENRYKELLKQAKNVQEILTIEKEIGYLRTEIESIEGRMKYLKDRVSMSTLTVVFYENISTSFGFGSKFIQGLENGWTGLLWVLIALINLWPFLLTGLIIFLLVRRFNKQVYKGK